VSAVEHDVFRCDQRLGARVAAEREVMALLLGADDAQVDVVGAWPLVGLPAKPGGQTSTNMLNAKHRVTERLTKDRGFFAEESGSPTRRNGRSACAGCASVTRSRPRCAASLAPRRAAPGGGAAQ